MEFPGVGDGRVLARRRFGSSRLPWRHSCLGGRLEGGCPLGIHHCIRLNEVICMDAGGLGMSKMLKINS